VLIVKPWLPFFGESLYIIEIQLLPQDLKPLRVRVLILFVFLVGCASARPISIQSRASDDISQPDVGVILSLTDFHFDPFYDPKLFQELVQSPPSEWSRIFSGSQVPGYGAYGKDSNYNLFVSALKHAALAAPKAEFILLAGDWLAHGFSDSYYQYAGNHDPQGLYDFMDKTITFLTQRIREQFPDVPIYPALGNADSYCGDYQLQPKGEFLRRTAETWKGLLQNGNDEQAFIQTFPSGGYYTASAPGTSKHRVVVLNTVFFSTDYRNQCGDPKDDPGGDQLRWLALQLKDAAVKGDKVWLLYHIPYGIDAYDTIIATNGKRVEKGIPLWQAGYQEAFLKLLNQYRSTILFTLAGHSHMDEFRLALDGETGRSSSFLLVTPAISPVFLNNPGLQVLFYDRKAFSLLDYTTHRLDLAAEPSADWKEEYGFSRAYSLFPFTSTTLETLSRSLLEEAQRRATYMRYYNVGNTASPQITDQTWPVYWCAIGHQTATDFQTCVENFSRP
jgi:sphingomyelin phosphodiesterase acid-like 3